jgi:hypothetical protein
MSNNAEEGIARIQAAVAQAKGTDGLKDHHKWTIAYLDERILVSIFAVAVIGLGVLWATTASPLLRYGSFSALILMTFLWGFVRIRRIETLKHQRAELAESWQADDQDTSGDRSRPDAD